MHCAKSLTNDRKESTNPSMSTKQSSLEKAIVEGIVFSGSGGDKPQAHNKVKTKAKRKAYITGQHGSASAQMKADIRRKRAERHKK